jgi:hypothetical protein
MADPQQITSYNTTRSELPTYLEPYAARALGSAESASSVPFQQYKSGDVNQRIAAFNPNQSRVQVDMMGMTQQPGYGIAQNATGTAMGQNWLNNASNYMNPYQQQVTDIGKREAIRQSDIQGLSSNAQFAKAGAFGGSRHGVVDAERQRNGAVQRGSSQHNVRWSTDGQHRRSGTGG